jgi:hypothetical protein
VGGSGSTGQITGCEIQGDDSKQRELLSNSIVITAGGWESWNRNTVSDNQCTAAFAGQTGSARFNPLASPFLFQPVGPPPPGTAIVHGNDIGIDAASGGDIDHNNVSDNLDFGLVLEPGYASEPDNTANGMNASCPSGTTSCDGIPCPLRQPPRSATTPSGTMDFNGIGRRRGGWEHVEGQHDDGQQQFRRGQHERLRDGRHGQHVVRGPLQHDSPSGLCN